MSALEIDEASDDPLEGRWSPPRRKASAARPSSSIKGVASRFVYSTTKAAVIGLTKSVAAATYTTGQIHIIDGGWSL